MVFVNSMSDLFHADIPEQYARDVFEVMLSTELHGLPVIQRPLCTQIVYWTCN